MSEKSIYVGSGKKRKDNWFTATLNLDKFNDHIQEYKGTKFIKININLRDEPDQYGKDVSLTIDQFVPEQKEETAKTSNPVDTDDLPF